MVRSLLFQDLVSHRLFRSRLYDLLKDSLAIVKELLMFYIIQDIVQDKLFRISKTTIQKNRSDGRFHRIGDDGIPVSSSGSFLTLAQQQITAKIDLPRAECKRRFADHAGTFFCQEAPENSCTEIHC